MFDDACIAVHGTISVKGNIENQSCFITILQIAIQFWRAIGGDEEEIEGLSSDDEDEQT